ncbi:MAG: hypothetical protein JXR70_07035 [Spirochaetales bacterium]|nr:hypothetical protein [Spirochaetales bacterium]
MTIHQNGHFNFDCQLCGECCTGAMRVQLNLYDLYKMAKHLKLSSTHSLFQKGLVQLVEKDQRYWIPIIKFKKWTIPYCPFLVNSMDEQEVLHGICSLHPKDKPLICSMAPLGRIIDFQNQSVEYCVTAPLEDCPGMGKKRENNIQEILDFHEAELNYQFVYYQMLDSLPNWKASKEMYLGEIYSFTTVPSFDEVFTSIKNNLIHLTNQKSTPNNALQ